MQSNVCDNSVSGAPETLLFQLFQLHVFVFKHHKETVLGTETFSKTTLKFQKKVSKDNNSCLFIFS